MKEVADNYGVLTKDIFDCVIKLKIYKCMLITACYYLRGGPKQILNLSITPQELVKEIEGLGGKGLKVCEILRNL